MMRKEYGFSKDKRNPYAKQLPRDDGAKGQDRAKGEGISFRFTTSADIDALAARARAAGAALDSEPMDGFGARFCRVRDLDGFRLVISSEPKPAG